MLNDNFMILLFCFYTITLKATIKYNNILGFIMMLMFKPIYMRCVSLNTTLKFVHAKYRNQGLLC